MSYELLTPVIDIQLRPMRNLAEETRKLVCTCPAQCKQYVNLDGYGRYCENAAREIALSIYSIVEGIHRIEPNTESKRRWWTLKEEGFIIDWYEKYGGVRYGDTRIIAGMLGRPYNGVRAKIKQMQRDGIL